MEYGVQTEMRTSGNSPAADWRDWYSNLTASFGHFYDSILLEKDAV